MISGILIKVEVSVVSDELKVNADNTHQDLDYSGYLKTLVLYFSPQCPWLGVNISVRLSTKMIVFNSFTAANDCKFGMHICLH